MASNGSTGPAGSSAGPGAVRQAQSSPVDLTQSTEPSLGELIASTTSDLSALLRSEVELAKVELKEEAKTAGQAGAMMGAAAVLGHMALLLLLFAVAWGLSEIVPEGVAFLIVAVLVGIAAFVAFTMGKKRLENFSPVPEQTVETLQEDVHWAKQLKS